MTKKVIIVQALKEERIELPVMEGYTFRQLFTGCGKVASAMGLLREVMTERPEAVINVGTVGAVNREVGDIVLCDRFVDRDLNPLCIYGIVSRSEGCVDNELLKRIIKLNGGELATCSTGDSFVTGQLEEGDVCDMEAFALSLVCSQENIPFLAVKYVTDIVGKNSVAAWESKLADARRVLTDYFSKI